MRFFLKSFEDSDFMLQQRARVLFVIVISSTIALVAFSVFFIVVDQRDPGVILPFAAAIVLMLGALFFLKKGHFSFYAHFLLVVALVSIWMVNFLESGPLVQRIDSITLILAVLTMTPLVFIRKGRGIILYFTVNIVLLLVYSIYIQITFNLENGIIREYMLDNVLAFSLTCVFCYSIFTIYKRSLEKAQKGEEEIQAQYEELAATSEELEAMNDELIKAHNDIMVSNQKINEERDRLATTLRSIGDGVITLTAEGNIETMNRAAEEILCRSTGDCREKHINEVFKIVSTRAEQALYDPIEKVLCEGEQVEMEGDVMLMCCDGTRKIISAIATPLYDSLNRINGAVIAFRDITERKRMEDEMLKASKIESLGVFAGGIAHDFNNLLTAILGSVSIVRLDMEEKNRNREFLLDAERACLRAKDLTQQLLTFSKGGAPIKTMASLKNLIKDTTAFVLSGSSVQCVYDIDEHLWNAEVDRGQISQVVHNLILNARQSMSGGGTIRVSAVNAVIDEGSSMPLLPGHYIRVSISDSGDGIRLDIQNKIFEPFFTTKMEGNGLGLAVTASIIRNHNGHIAVLSVPGEGATFEFYLPASMEKVMEEKEILTTSSFDGVRVLLMDDDEIVLRVAEHMLQRLGCEVQTSRDGSKAIELYRDSIESGSRFKVVIMDLTVPGAMGGKDAMVELKKLDPDIRAIVSSGYANDPVMARFHEYGFCGYVIKPYKIEELGRAILKALT